MDFILKDPDSDFQLKPHLKTISDELLAYGYNIEIIDQSNANIAVRKVFIKDDLTSRLLKFW